MVSRNDVEEQAFKNTQTARNLTEDAENLSNDENADENAGAPSVSGEGVVQSAEENAGFSVIESASKSESVEKSLREENARLKELGGRNARCE